jgi:hypothetical protein
MNKTQIKQPAIESQYFVQNPSELLSKMNCDDADIVIMPQKLSLDLENHVRNAACGEERSVLDRHQASQQVWQSLQSMGIECPQLVTPMVEAIDVFAETFERQSVELRLELTDQQSCPKFHCDNVYVRMLVTFFGPTTEFIDLSEPHRIHRAPLNSLVFLKGHQHPTYGDRVLHRSPEFSVGEKRLCMIVNFCDWLPS